MPADAERIAALASQLGYPVPVAWIAEVLQRETDVCAVLVAVVPRAGVVGWAAVSRQSSLLRSDFVELEGLIVEDEYRGHRIGERLVQAAQGWARRRSCSTMVVRSNVIRERARRFYLRLGFDVIKAQNVFESRL